VLDEEEVEAAAVVPELAVPVAAAVVALVATELDEALFALVLAPAVGVRTDKAGCAAELIDNKDMAEPRFPGFRVEITHSIYRPRGDDT